MANWQFARSITSMRLMAELAESHGLGLADSLRDTGVAATDLDNPEAVISAHQELQMIRNLVDGLGDVPGLGLEAGARYHFTSFGALGFALVSSPTLRDALDVALGYFKLTFAFTEFQVSDAGDETLIRVDDAGLPMELRRFILERDMRALVTVQQDLFPGVEILRRATFSFADPGYGHLYEDVLSVRPEFEARCNLAVLDRGQLLMPLPQANPLAQKVAIEQCRQMLDVRMARTRFSATVRDLLAQELGQQGEMEAVASALNTSVRTLRRRLAQEGTGYRELRDEVRQTLAAELLGHSYLSVAQIADRLGYAEPTSFINACKRWYGLTPLRFRRQATGKAAPSGVLRAGH
ncbi:MAG: AraC family transcriptional regulator [Marinobacter sp.]|uniref:AraC family transcriptional regulator n=1 Tax=Marinobacter sp. TaxID=50741 RepID=UPI00299EA3D4|nr:AraC family transcriptional regulator [Marinobacter sp.]MDX1755536.1 AraC family transcriptional regulator [Marinobacter sp.]